jgi:hypothetical protein
MIMANYAHSNMKSALMSYDAWLSPFLTQGTSSSLVDEIVTSEKDLMSAMSALDLPPSKYTGHTCTQDVKNSICTVAVPRSRGWTFLPWMNRII